MSLEFLPCMPAWRCRRFCSSQQRLMLVPNLYVNRLQAFRLGYLEETTKEPFQDLLAEAYP